MYSCWQLKRHTYFRSSGQFDLFGLGDHRESCVISDSELVGRVRMINSTSIAETGTDRRITVVLEEWSWFEIIGPWKAYKLELW
jgi:hypothetical protein